MNIIKKVIVTVIKLTDSSFGDDPRNSKEKHDAPYIEETRDLKIKDI